MNKGNQFQKKPPTAQQPAKKFASNSPQVSNAKPEPKWNNNNNAQKTGNNAVKKSSNQQDQAGQSLNKGPNASAEAKKSFTGRSRLFIGNLSEDTTEEILRKSLSQYGSITELYVNGKRGFAFVKFETKQGADAAKDALDGKKLNNRIVRLRFAAHGAALKLKNLSPHVTNELLDQAFSSFGVVERCVHIVDDRGRPIGEGIVEFSKKSSCQMALKKCTEGCFLLGSYPKPVIVEPLEQNDEEDGLQEKNVSWTNQFNRDREKGPRFVPRGSFEFDFAMRWKDLFELEKQKREELERDITVERSKLEEQMELALYEQETAVLREQLRRREEEANQLLREREMRQRRVDQQHQSQRMDDMFQNSPSDGMRQRPNAGMAMDDMRRRQDSPMMMQRDVMQRNSKMGGMNMNSGERGMHGGHMDGNMRSMQGGNANQMSGMSPLVGAPVPPAELLSSLPSSRKSRFDQPGGFPGNISPQVDSGIQMSRSPMDRNEPRGSPMMGGMQGMNPQPFKRSAGGPNPMSDRWEDKRRRF